MSARLLRGRVLSFRSRPQARDDHKSYLFEEDGAVLVENGRISACGVYDEIRLNSPLGVEVIDHRPLILMAGFIDPHIHFPQMQVTASYAANLLEWLNTYTFVEEQKFADAAHAARFARLFFDELLRHGTTTAAAYCSVHKGSADAFFTEATRRNLLMVGSKVMMDRNAPAALTDTAQSGYDDTKAVIAAWHGKGRNHVAITPRFAITSSPAQLEAAGTLAREHPDLLIQTHLSENNAEIAYTMELFPEAQDYTDVYARHGLLTRKMLLGHAIHLSDREMDAIADAGAVAVHCPTSNLFLGSGLFDLKRLKEHGVRTAIATDIGGGSSYSMLRTMDEAYKIQQLRNNRLPPLESFWQATRGNAEALGLVNQIGTLEPGTDADIIALDAGATPAMAIRMETVETLEEELFLLQTMGDDRAVRHVYVAGKAVQTRSATN
ncbi:MAG: guanine deaminase [Hoeflea sp.]|uniref:guanine deaminase n=1 Tax=Hoeflea sp. TaxID=1940281 RepID=UPI001D366B52|nr:guanine deaminase [Hoeflea sp.]MBU4527657.1 guanine deaminase [Alphaproteobacteria bacterium]MBU4546475.1 guanine deaminase [Alphaproteobacteria bacterium]MBU4553007.1 guanine deaminase [Alphaproteobacteria bacterium]MBV1724079.1 guanine deaminase [Hoeflea sp.]MBV1759764.1 guanine deaminase [Hoeflea sp.]